MQYEHPDSLRQAIIDMKQASNRGDRLSARNIRFDFGVSDREFCLEELEMLGPNDSCRAPRVDFGGDPVVMHSPAGGWSIVSKLHRD